MREDLPTGTVTLLFTDIEGSTQLLHELGDRYSEALAEHHRVLREVWSRHDGVEVDTAGDAFFVAFARASDAVAAATAAQLELGDGPFRVRMGLHSGEPLLGETGYVGRDVHLAARIGAVAHGGQVVVSRRTRELAEVELRDLGEHRIKDFDEAVWLFQVGDESFPPLRTIANSNLPRPASSFVGRAREVGEIVALLRAGARLVTLSGPGGTGKTRLALESATELVADYQNGVFWVPLATIRDSALVPAAIARMVGAKGTLAAHFAGKRSLLLLDNLEQVVDAAAELAALIEASPDLALLVTSRELLRVQGEVEYPVAPLDKEDAVALFCIRSRLPRDATIAELCRRLDQLPLAVELAAARSSVLAPAQILERLTGRLDLLKGGRDADPRHATLRATIAWSHDLLGEREQRLFACLSVFSGGCTLDAVETVCEADLDTLASLIEKSLVRHTGERYWMLETIREFALERLEGTGGAAAVRERHARLYLELAEVAAPQLRGPRQTELLDCLEAEHPNLRAALDDLRTGAAEFEARLAGACWYFWYARGHFREGREHLRAALERWPELPPRVRVQLHDGLTTFESLLGNDEGARAHAEESVRLYQELDDPDGLLRGLLNQSFAVLRVDADAGRAPLDELIKLARSLGNRWYLSVALGKLGSIALDAGDLDLAHRLYVEALEVAREAGDQQIETSWETVVAQVRLELGLTTEASAGFAAGIAQASRLSLHESLLWGIEGAAALAAHTDRPEQAAWLFGSVDTLAAAMDYPLPPFFVARRRALREQLHARLTPNVVDRAWQDGASATVEQVVAAALEVCKHDVQTRT